MRPDIHPFRHESTGTWSYVVSDPEARKCAIVDPVLDFDPKSGKSGTASAETIAAHLRERGALRHCAHCHPRAAVAQEGMQSGDDQERDRQPHADEAGEDRHPGEQQQGGQDHREGGEQREARRLPAGRRAAQQRDAGITSPLFVFQSNGGVAAPVVLSATTRSFWSIR